VRCIAAEVEQGVSRSRSRSKSRGRSRCRSRRRSRSRSRSRSSAAVRQRFVPPLQLALQTPYQRVLRLGHRSLALHRSISRLLRRLSLLQNKGNLSLLRL